MIRVLSLQEFAERFKLPKKVYDSLVNYGISGISDLLSKSEKELLAIPGIGKSEFQEIQSAFLLSIDWVVLGFSPNSSQYSIVGISRSKKEAQSIADNYIWETQQNAIVSCCMDRLFHKEDYILGGFIETISLIDAGGMLTDALKLRKRKKDDGA